LKELLPKAPKVKVGVLLPLQLPLLDMEDATEEVGIVLPFNDCTWIKRIHLFIMSACSSR
jgi:hypothetical protein